MKLCRYCDKKISWWGGIDHSICEETATNHTNYLRNYTKQLIIKGEFDISSVSDSFKVAEKYLSSSEVSDALAYGYTVAMEDLADDRMIDDEEGELVIKFINNLVENSNESMKEVLAWLNVYGANNTYLQSRTMYEFDQGKLPNAEPPSGLMMNKGEKFIYSFSNVSCHALNIKTRFRGRSTGGSYKLSKNISLRHTEHRGKPVSYSEWKRIGSGTLAITNKHLYFLGYADSRDVKERLSKVISLEPVSDGFIININLKTRPAYRFKMDSGEAWMASNFLMGAQEV